MAVCHDLFLFVFYLFGKVGIGNSKWAISYNRLRNHSVEDTQNWEVHGHPQSKHTSCNDAIDVTRTLAVVETIVS